VHGEEMGGRTMRTVSGALTPLMYRLVVGSFMWLRVLVAATWYHVLGARGAALCRRTPPKSTAKDPFCGRRVEGKCKCKM
jgi:hypothetical protein